MRWLRGVVLEVLASTYVPLLGRKVAALSNGRLSQKGTSLALRYLAEHGIVLVEDHPPSKLYTLNEQHLATSSIRALAGMRSRLIAQLKDRLRRWEYPPSGAWLFGSVARGDGGVASDIDLFVIRPDTADGGDQWDAQVDELTEAVRSWTGNPCSIVDLSEAEFARLDANGERLVDEVRRDGIHLIGECDLGVPRHQPTHEPAR